MSKMIKNTRLKKVLAFTITLTMVVTMMPMLGIGTQNAYAAGGNWSVSYNADTYQADELLIGIYDVTDEVGETVTWTTESGLVIANKTASQLFETGHSYKAIVQNVAIDGSIRAEYERYIRALQQTAWTEEWSALPETDDPEFPDDESKADYPGGEQDFYAAKLAEQMEFATTESMKQTLDGLAAYPMTLPHGYTIGDYSPFVKVKTVDLTGANPTLDIGADFFDDCKPITWTLPDGNFTTPSESTVEVGGTPYTTTSASTYLDGSLGLFLNEGGKYIPAAIDIYDYVSAKRASGIQVGGEGNEEEPESDGPDVSGFEETMITLMGGKPGDELQNGSIYPEFSYYVPAGSYTMTYCDDRLATSIADWEAGTVGDAGGSWNFASGRSYGTVSAPLTPVVTSGDVTISLQENNTSPMLTVSLTASNSFTGNITPKNVSVKPAAYSNVSFSVVEMDANMAGIDFTDPQFDLTTVPCTMLLYGLSKTGGLTVAQGASTNIPIGSINTPDWVPALTFKSKETGAAKETYTAGEAVEGKLALAKDGLELNYAGGHKGNLDTVMSAQYDSVQDFLAYYDFMDIRAEYTDGTLITGANQIIGTFNFNAPAVTSTVSASAILDLKPFEVPDGETIINISEQTSAEIVVTAAPDATPPAVPTGLAQTTSNNNINFTWDANQEADLAGYRLYRTDNQGAAIGSYLKQTATTGEAIVINGDLGTAPWYFALSAYDAAGNESAKCSYITVQDPNSAFRGAGTINAASGSMADGLFTLTNINEGSILAAFTAEASVLEENLPASMTAVINYKTLTGAAIASAPITLTKSERIYSGSLSIDQNMATLVSAEFKNGNDVIASTPINVDIKANVSFELPVAEYPIAANFDKVKLTKGSGEGTVNTDLLAAEGNIIGQYLRKDYETTTAEFYVGTEDFAVTGETLYSLLSDQTKDKFVLTAAKLPDKIMIDMSYSPDTLGKVHLYLDYLGADDAVVRSENYTNQASNAAIYSSANNGDITKLKVRLVAKNSDMSATSDSTVVTSGETYTKGHKYTVEASVIPKGLEKYMYISVLCGENGDAPAKSNLNLVFEPTGDGGENTNPSYQCKWYYKTGQVDVSGLTPGKTYDVTFADELEAFEQTSVRVTVPNSNPASAAAQGTVPTLKLYDKINICLDLFFELADDDYNYIKSNEAVPNLRQYITPQIKVYYQNKSGNWVEVQGTVSEEINIHGEVHVNTPYDNKLRFRSEGIERRDVNLDAGLKIVTEGKADLYVNSGGIIQYPNQYKEMKLSANQEFYTNNQNHVSATDKKSYFSMGSEGQTYGAAYFASAFVMEWTFVGDVLNVGIVKDPIVKVLANRTAEAGNAAFVFKNTGTGEVKVATRQFAMTLNGGEQKYSFPEIDYGTYDILFYLYDGSRNFQLEEQFATAPTAFASHSEATASSQMGVAISNEANVISFYTPPLPPQAGVEGIQGVTVTPNKTTVISDDLLTFDMKFTYVPGQEAKTITFSGDNFTVNGLSVSLKDSNGNTVVPTAQTLNSVTLPTDRGTLTGVIAVSGTVGAANTQPRLDATDGSTTWYGVSQMVTFSHNLQEKSAKKTIVAQGRYASNKTIIATITSRTNAAATTTSSISVSKYGYWNKDIVLPVSIQDGKEIFDVVFKDNGSEIGRQTIEYTATAEILPSQIDYTYFFNGVQETIRAVPGENKKFDALNKAVVTFGTDYGTRDITLKVKFDDTDASRDSNGYTDAMKVGIPTLIIDGPVSWKYGSYSFQMDPIDKKTKAVGKTMVVDNNGNISEEDSGTLTYSTEYEVKYRDKYYGTINIDYDILNPAGIEIPQLDEPRIDTNAVNATSLAAIKAEWGEWKTELDGADGDRVFDSETISGTVEGVSMGLTMGDLIDEGLIVNNGAALTDSERNAVVADDIVDMEYNLTHNVTTTAIGLETDMQWFIDSLSMNDSDTEGDWIYWKASDPDAVIQFVRYKAPSYYLEVAEDQGELAGAGNGTKLDLVTKIEYEYVYNLRALNESAQGFRSMNLRLLGSNGNIEVVPMLLAAGGQQSGNPQGPAPGSPRAIVNAAVGGVYQAGEIINKGIETVNTSLEITEVLNLRPNPTKIPPARKLDGSALVGKVGGKALGAVGVIGKVKGIGETILTDEKAEEKKTVAAMKAELLQVRNQSIKRCGCMKDPNGAATELKILQLYDEGIGAINSILEGLEMQENINDGIDIAQDVAPSKFNVYGLVANFSIDAVQYMTNDVIDSGRWHDVNNVYMKYYNGMSRASFACDPKKCKEEEKPKEPVIVDNLTRKASVYIGPSIDPSHIIDPSGTVYEGTIDNPLADVTCTIQYKNGATWEDWTDAPLYNQQQTSIETNISGYYRWDVPFGTWRVKYYKDGYNGNNPVYSGEMPVPPVWLDVNQNMIATTAPTVSAISQGGNIILNFSKPVQWADINSTNAAVTIGNTPLAGSWSIITGSTGNIYSNNVTFDTNGVPNETPTQGQLVTKVMFTPVTKQQTGTTYNVQLGAGTVNSYANIPVSGTLALTGTIAGGTAPAPQGGGGGSAVVVPVETENETVTATPAGGEHQAFKGDMNIKVGQGIFKESTKIELSKSKGSEEGKYSPIYGVAFTVQPSDTAEISFKLFDKAKTVDDTKKLGMWVKPLGQSEWTFAGGAYDSATNSLTLLTRVSGEYKADYKDYNFSDLSDKHWASQYIEILAARHIMLGDNLGHANADNPITRAETAALLVRVLQANSLIGRTPAVTDNYSDVDEDDWFYYPINLASKRGIISGYGDGTAKPNNHVTREELAAIFAKAMLNSEQIAAGGTTLDFNDKEQIADWAKAYIAVLKDMKFLSGDTQNNFNPKKKATRAEVAKLMYMMMDKYGILIYDENAEEIPCLTCPYSR